MLKYNFVIGVNENRITQEQTREKGFRVESPYNMLGYLSYGCRRLDYVKEIIEQLQKILFDQQENYGPWGHELTYITSYKEKSLLTYIEYTNENEFEEFQTEVPTFWLLKLMEDWLIFLEKQEDGTEQIVYAVWIPPLD